MVKPHHLMPIILQFYNTEFKLTVSINILTMSMEEVLYLGHCYEQICYWIG